MSVRFEPARLPGRAGASAMSGAESARTVEQTS